MAIADAMRGAAQSLFRATQSLSVAGEYHESTGISYNTAAGSVARTSNKHTINPVFVDLGDREMNGVASQPTDRIALISAAEIPSTVVPKLSDWIIVGSDTWEIHKIERDPSRGVFIMLVRISGPPPD